jgi:integral membrane sensor domain MASE1
MFKAVRAGTYAFTVSRLFAPCVTLLQHSSAPGSGYKETLAPCAGSAAPARMFASHSSADACRGHGPRVWPDGLDACQNGAAVGHCPVGAESKAEATPGASVRPLNIVMLVRRAWQGSRTLVLLARHLWWTPAAIGVSAVCTLCFICQDGNTWWHEEVCRPGA